MVRRIGAQRSTSTHRPAPHRLGNTAHHSTREFVGPGFERPGRKVSHSAPPLETHKVFDGAVCLLAVTMQSKTRKFRSCRAGEPRQPQGWNWKKLLCGPARERRDPNPAAHAAGYNQRCFLRGNEADSWALTVLLPPYVGSYFRLNGFGLARCEFPVRDKIALRICIQPA